ncbi:MAG: hypothetical protein JNJ71_03260 [Rubrivivax sp.]|nr:hypothetical protein [Rubrivivax sp.]
MLSTAHPAAYRTEAHALAEAAPSLRDTLCRLWAGHAGIGGRAQQKLRHAYLNNPAGAGRCLLLRTAHDADAVGVIGLHQRQWWRGAEARQVLALTDFVVDRSHRTLGPALQLMRAAVADGLQAQDLVYGLPNAASQAVAQRAGLRRLGTLPRLGKLLRSAFLLRRQGLEQPPRALTVPMDAALAGFDAAMTQAAGVAWRWREGRFDDALLARLWAARDPTLWLADRSPEVLAWRFSPEAEAGWQLSLAESARSDQTALGYVVWRRAGELVDIADVLCNAPQEQLASLLRSFARRMRRHTEATALTLEFSGSPALMRQLARAGFVAKETGAAVFGLAPGDERLWAAGPPYFTRFDRDPDV